MAACPDCGAIIRTEERPARPARTEGRLDRAVRTLSRARSRLDDAIVGMEEAVEAEMGRPLNVYEKFELAQPMTATELRDLADRIIRSAACDTSDSTAR